MKERLDKCLSTQMNISRAEAGKLIRFGGAAVNNRAVRDPSFKVDGEKDTIMAHGRVIRYRQFVYIEMNKPQGVVSATKDPNEKTVVDLVEGELKRKNLFPAGRLDKDTTGFMIITDDGDFAHDILSPKKHIEKTYIAVTDEDIASDKLEIIRNGLQLETVSFSPAEIELCEETQNGYSWRIVLKEGKYHEIKRMIAYAGVQLLSLHRIKMGGLELDEKLKPGEYRELTADELKMIKENRGK